MNTSCHSSFHLSTRSYFAELNFLSYTVIIITKVFKKNNGILHEPVVGKKMVIIEII